MDFDEGYRLATEHSNEGVVIVSGNKRLFVNQRLIELTGYHTIQEFDKIPFLSTVHPDDRERVKEIIKKRQAGKPAPSLYEFRFLRPDGSIIYVEISSCSITYRGQPASLGYLRDISDRKQIEEKLRRSEEKYRNILENMQDGYFEQDLAGNFTFVNDAICKRTGYNREEIIGINNRLFQDETTAEKMYQIYYRIYRTGEPVRAVECEYFKKGGTKGFNELSVSLVRDAEGKPIGFRGTTRDVTERKQTEEIILRSEKRFKTLYQESPIPTFTWQKKGDDLFLIDCNRAAILLTEGRASNYMGKSAQELYRERPEIIADLLRCFKEQSTISKELVSQHFVPGRFLSVHYSYVPPDLVIVHMEDITERKRAEEALRKSEEKYRTILESIEEGYYEVDLAGNYTFFNDSLCHILGSSCEEVTGTNYRQYVDKENAIKLFKGFNEIYRTGVPTKIVDYEITRKNGTKCFLETSASLLRDSSGKTIGFRGVVRNVTEHKKSKEALRQSEEKYRNILENIQEGYFELDLAGNYTFVNDAECRNIGYPREELIGMNNRQYQDEATIKRAYQAFNNMYKTGKSIRAMDTEIIQKDGTKKFNEISAALIRDSKGKKIGFSGVSRDITERKRAEEALKKNQEELLKKNQELEESRKNIQITLERLGAAYEELKITQAKILQQEKMASIGQLAAGVAHEINNPMAFIASNLGTLDKYIRRLKDFIQAQSEAIKSLKATDTIKQLDKKRKELKLDYTVNDIDLLVKESIDGSERVQKIVRELNRFSRVDDEVYKDTNINECIESSINIVWNELKDKATLNKDYGDLPLTKCYPLKLDQVFINLLINAIQAIEEKGKIEIKTWEKDRSIWIAISDTGCGIPRKNQNKIFEPFFTTKEVGKGAGLGLSVSYEIIQMHKGEISFESKEGKGTTFTIRMPIV